MTTKITADNIEANSVTIESLNVGGAFSFRNKIINGNFDIWQRGTSQTSTGYGSADRWRCGNSGSTKTASRQSFTLGQTDVSNNPKYFMRHEVTSVAGASSFTSMQQYIEGVETLSGKTATLSFWAKADSSKNIAVEFYQGFGTGGSPSDGVSGIGAQLVALTTSWAKYTVTVDLPSVSGKTLGTSGNDWLGIFFWFDAGSNFDARSASLGQQSGTFDIAQVQLEEGSAATPFEQRSIDSEFSLCQRYLYGIVANSVGMRFGTGSMNSSTLAMVCFDFLRMRAPPTGTISNFEVYSAGSRAISSLDTAGSVPLGSVDGTRSYAVYVVFTCAASTLGYAFNLRATATGAYFFLDAEL